jgi:hypothetical protein
VTLHGFAGDLQTVSDLLVSKPLADQPNYLHLTIGQAVVIPRIAPVFLRELLQYLHYVCGTLPIDPVLTGSNGVDALKELVQRTLQHDTSRAELQGFDDLPLGDGRREDDGAKLRVGVGNLPECVKAGKVGHQEIQKEKIGLELSNGLNCLATVVRFGENFIAAVLGKDMTKDVANNWIVVGNHNSHRLRFSR